MSAAHKPERGGAAAPALPTSLRTNRRLSQWLRFDAAGFVEVFSGKVEIGQGILTALAQIVADELDISLPRVRMITASTAVSPDEALTAGSLSVQESGTALRLVCAEVRSLCLRAAAERLGQNVDALAIHDGSIGTDGGRQTSYWEIAAAELLDREATAQVSPKPAGAHRVVCRTAERLDLADKVFGQPCFIHDLDLPAMLHGRVLRPATPDASLAGLDEQAVRALAGEARVVRDGSFVAVLAETEAAAEAAAQKLAAHARWEGGGELPDAARLPQWLKAQEAETSIVDSRSADRVSSVARTLKATYTRPYLAHAAIGPACALARMDTSSDLRVWTHSQGIFNLRRDLAAVLGLEEGRIVVQHVQGAGCYGHNGADDVAFDAARLAQAAAGRPVRVQWSRADDLSWAPFGPSMVVDVEADLDHAGAIVGWRHEVWSNGHVLRPGRTASPALLGAWHLAAPFARPPATNPPVPAGGGAERNAIPLYAFPAWQIISHRVLAMPLRTSALRSLGAYANVFAIESFIDEIAATQGADPVAFRLRYLNDPRARAVIERAAAKARWGEWRKRDGHGRGIGFACYKNTGAYCAVVAEIEAEAEIRVRRLVIAVDVGLVINPDGVANQIEGGAIQSTSWTLKEAVRFDRARVTSDNWDDYPIWRCSEAPAVEVEIVSRPEQPAAGAGEAAQGPTAAAIGNAVFDALGVRIRDLPLTSERIITAAS